MDPRTTLTRLLDASIIALLNKIESGEATAADLNVARQFLKDNGVDAIPTKSNPLGALEAELPYQSAEDIAADQEQFH